MKSQTLSFILFQTNRFILQLRNGEQICDTLEQISVFLKLVSDSLTSAWSNLYNLKNNQKQIGVFHFW